jgi:sn-glycerol 3-phosphate transport system permease protein
VEKSITAPGMLETSVEVTTRKRSAHGAHAWRSALDTLGYAAPALILFTVFTYWPFLRAIWLSLHITNATGEIVKFNGLAYYTRVLTSPEYLESIWLTFKFALMVVPAGIASGVGLAVLAAVKLRHVKIFRTLFTSSIAISLASAGVIFTMFYSPVIGVTQGLEQLLGLKSPGLLANAETALAAVAAMTVWSGLGFNFVICLSGIQAIPDEIFESGMIDGASGWKSFIHLTLPLLAPTLLFLLVIGTIQSAQAFTQFSVLMQGPGPQGSTNVFVYSTFRTFWLENRYGFSSAMSIVLFAILFVLSLIQFRGLDRRVHYQ